MSRTLAARLFRRPAVRLAVDRLEDRTAPALFVAQPAQAPSGLRNNGCVAVGDFDADGKTDIVLTNYGLDNPESGLLPGQKLSVMLGLGNGQFKNPSHLTVGTDQYVSFVVVADLDADGKQDLICCSTTANTQVSRLTVYEGDGGGGFNKVAQLDTDSKNADWVGVGQLTKGDTNLDIVVSALGFGVPDVSVTHNGFTVFQGDGNFNFTNIARVGNGVLAFEPIGGGIADLNGDGNQDLVFSNPGVPADTNSPYPDGTIDVYLNNGAGGFTPGNAFPSGGPFPINLQIADFNADGKQDVVVANAGQVGSFGQGGGSFGQDTSLGVLLGTGSGNFGGVNVLTAGLTSGSSTAAFAPEVADFDQDGKLDISAIVYGTESILTPGPALVAVYTGNGTGGFSPDTNSPYTPTGLIGGQYLAAGKFDSNSTPDIVAVGLGSKVVTLLNQTATGVATSTTLQSSANPASYGTSITFTAAVTSAGGTPSGSVTFYDAITPIGGPVALDALGKATFSISTLGVAAHAITAKYSGGSGFASSASAAVNQVINQATTLTTLQAAPTTVVSGDPVTLTATVTSISGAAPAGTVTFFDSGTQLGSPVTLTAGAGGQQAVLVTTALPTGIRLVTATYSGNANFLNGTSNTVAVTVNNPTPPPVTPTITLVSSSNPSTLSSPVTFTVTVSAPAGLPTGTVTFFRDGVQLGTPVVLSGTPSKATLTSSTLTVGTHTITASYGGDTGFNPITSGPLTQVVNPVSTGVALSTDLSPATVTLPITFTATVTAGITPLGAVQFFRGGVAMSGLVALGANNKASFTTSALEINSHTITAQFVPATGDFAGSTSGPLTQVVQKAGLGITVTSGGAVLAGQPVTLTANITKLPSIAPGLTGLVTFKRLGGGDLGTAAVVGNTAQLTTTLAVGDSVITAEYAGDANYNAAASPNFTQTVNKGGVTVSLVGSSPTTVGQSVTFLVSVAESPTLTPDPTGQVALKLNGATIGTALLDKGSASFATTVLPVGDNSITAEYAGDANFLGGTAGPINQKMLPIGTAVSIGTNSTPAIVSQTVTLSATVSASAGTPTGTVQFFRNGVAISSLLPLSVGAATFATSALPVGTSDITARFVSNDPTYSASTSATLAQGVQKAAATLTLAVDVATADQPSTLRATITRPGGVSIEPGGIVTFKVNGVVAGTGAVVGGRASAAAVLPVGTNTVTAEYGGDDSYVTGTVNTSATIGSGGGTGTVQKPNLVGYPQFGVGAGAGHTADSRFYNPNGSERFAAANLFGGTGGVRVSSADFTGDGVADLIAGTGPGGASRVVVLDGVTQKQLFALDPFEARFVGGVYVTAGDLTGDGKPDLVISPDEGGGPRVRVFNGNGFGQVADFYGIEDIDFRGGARAAVADLNGDGTGDLVVSAGFGGGPRVAVFTGTALGADGGPKLYPDFYVFEDSLRNGAFVAAGDVNGDGRADLIAGGGPGGGPRVSIFDANDLLNRRTDRRLADFFAFDPDNRGGVRVVARDLDGDNQADLVAGAGPGAGSKVSGFSGKTLMAAGTSTLFSFDAFPGFSGGVYVG